MSPKATRAVMEAARTIVRVRDGHRCQMCGRSILNFPSNIHHRINRGSGGSALLERPSLLIRICGSGTTFCHGWVTEHAEAAGDLGWVLPKNNPYIDPEQEKILTHEYGWILLQDDGSRLPYLGEATA